MSTALSRTGPTVGNAGAAAAGGIASATAAVQAAWAALVAYYHRLRCGRGDYIDFSRFEAVVQCTGSAVRIRGPGRRRPEAVRRAVAGPAAQPADLSDHSRARTGSSGSVVLSPRQWRGMRAWLGEPEQFADPKFDTIAARYAASTRTQRRHRRAVRARRRWMTLVAEGQRRGVPIAAVLTPCGGAGLGALPRGRRADRRRTRHRRDCRVPAGRSWSTVRHAGYSDTRARSWMPTSPRGRRAPSDRPTWPARRRAAVRRDCGYSTSA